MRQHFSPCQNDYSQCIRRRRHVGRSEALVVGRRWRSWRSWQAEEGDKANTKESPLRQRPSPTGILAVIAIVSGAATIGKYDPVRAFVTEAPMLRDPEAFADGFVSPLQARNSASGSGSGSTSQTGSLTGTNSLGVNGAI
jgi:hypothetical protein